MATCLQKITQDNATSVLIVPIWTTQPWFTGILNLLMDKPLILPQSNSLLTQPHNGDLQPLRHHLRLMSWSAGTQKQYQPYIAKWLRFCAERKINPYNPPLNIVLDFLVHLHNQDLKYTTINAARSAISAIILPQGTTTIGSHPITSRLMNGICRSKPPRPKYQTAWDVQPVLTYLFTIGTAKNLDLKMLDTVALVSAQSGQSLHMLDITLMKQDESSFEFLLPEHVEQSRSGYTPDSIVLHAFPAHEKLCVFYHMRTYINQTKPLRGNETKLFISYMKLHHRISRDTITRWIRQTMTNAGFDTQIFKPHSTRAAATLKVKTASVPIRTFSIRQGGSHRELLISFIINTLSVMNKHLLQLF
ncbi:Gag-Pro-Pol poly [Paramuricea clavata]|uniref:Gag-Pro-Pol poly n=1 Tax=Paramuricea clavata TaxID=317549 RepID=A0A6S7IDN9_PARCT|nr:Gag-Pro-Pol poly [Paramuricea clavata]